MFQHWEKDDRKAMKRLGLLGVICMFLWIILLFISLYIDGIYG